MILELKKIKVCHCFHFFPFIYHDVMGCHNLSFLNVEFKPAFYPPPSFTLIKRLFSSSWFSAIGWYHMHIWSCWYFSWQSWFQLVIHPAWHFTWCTLQINSISRVTNIQPWLIPFPVLNQSVFHGQLRSSKYFFTQKVGMIITVKTLIDCENRKILDVRDLSHTLKTVGAQ